MSQSERKAQIDSTQALPVTQQFQVLSISRSSAYYRPKQPTDEDLIVMRHMDELHLRYPFYGARRLRDGLLDEHGLIVNRKRVTRLMMCMGDESRVSWKQKHQQAKQSPSDRSLFVD